MALIIRTDQRAEFVHNTDTDCDKDGRKAPDENWYHAAGQPTGCTRIGVRPLSPDEWAKMKEYEDGEARVLYAHSAGFLGLDGDGPVDVGFGFAAEIGSLVIAITMDPMSGRDSKSTAEKSTGSKGSKSSGRSRSRSKR